MKLNFMNAKKKYKDIYINNSLINEINYDFLESNALFSSELKFMNPDSAFRKEEMACDDFCCTDIMKSLIENNYKDKSDENPYKANINDININDNTLLEEEYFSNTKDKIKKNLI